MGDKLSIKMLLIGDSAVGKTCMLMRYVESSFQADHMSTIGVDFKVKRLEIDGKSVAVNLWDTAGQERFKHITKSFYKGANGIMVCYSVTERQTFVHVENWLSQIAELADSKVQIVIAANKVDLAANRVVSEEEGRALAQKHKLEFFECSAKTDVNIEETFLTLVKKVLKNQSGDLLVKKRLDINNQVLKGQSSKRCC